MKYLIIVVYFTFLTWRVTTGQLTMTKNEEPRVLAETREQSRACSLDLEADRKQIGGELKAGLYPEGNEAFNKYIGCIWKQKKIINEKSEVNEANFKKYLVDMLTMGKPITAEQERVVQDVLNECSYVQDTDYGAKSVKLSNCFINYLYEINGE